MYGFPADFDPSVFVGHRLESVLFAEHVIWLRFSEDLAIRIEGTVRLQESPADEGVLERPVSAPEAKESRLVGAVGRVVDAAELSRPDELRLQLSGKYTITLTDDSPMYECLLIALGDREIVV